MKFTALLFSLLTVMVVSDDAGASSPSNETAAPLDGTDNFAPSASPTAVLIDDEESEAPEETDAPLDEVEETPAPVTASPTTPAPVTAAPSTLAPATAAPTTAEPTSADTDVVEDEEPEPEEVIETGSPAIAPQEPSETVDVVTTTDGQSSEMPSDVPSSMPSAAPFMAEGANTANTANTINSATCASNVACVGLSLEGDCCPTSQNWTLACCGGPDIPVAQSCASNDRCVALGLEGACCPTMDNGNSAYLDCCSVLPDDCVDASSCEVISAIEYKLELDQRAKEASGVSTPSLSAAAVAVVLAAIL